MVGNLNSFLTIVSEPRITLSQIIWNITGVLSLVIGAIGIFLPILPTTPFVLLASACLLRGSPKLHAKLLLHPTFGPIIVNWNQNRSISKPIKTKAYLFIFASFASSIYFAPVIWVKWSLLVILVVLITWFYRIPTQELVAETKQNH
jgi:uncharacterized membrane protein YbaN (DUF454 family)